MLETIKRGLAATIMAPCKRSFERYGKSLVAAIAFYIGIKFLIDAPKLIP